MIIHATVGKIVNTGARSLHHSLL